MKIDDNGVIRAMTPEEIALLPGAIEAEPSPEDRIAELERLLASGGAGDIDEALAILRGEG